MKYKTIDDIRELLLNSKLSNIIQIVKKDGITLECYTEKESEVEEGIAEVRKLCKNYKLKSPAFDKDETKTNMFYFQLPEFEPSTEDLIDISAADSFRWLLQNVNTNRVNTTNKVIDRVPKDVVIQHKVFFVKQAIYIYYRNFVNYYKIPDVNTLVEDTTLQERFGEIFDKYVEEKY